MSPRHSIPALALLTWALAIWSPATGQLLDLAPPPPLPNPAELALVRETGSRLAVELDRLRLARTVASPRQQPAIDAMIALRELVEGDLAEAIRSPDAWLELSDLLRLVEGLPTLDAAVRGTLAPAAGEGPIEGLRRFNAAVSASHGETPSVRRRAALSILLCALDPHTLPETLWPRDDGRGEPVAAVAPPTARGLRERLESSRRSEPPHTALRALVDAAEGPDSPESLRLRVAVGQLIDLLDASSASGLLERARREAFENHVVSLAAGLAASSPLAAPDALALLGAGEAGATARLLTRAEAARNALGEASRTLSALPPLLLRLDTQVAPDASPPPWRSKRAVEALLAELVESRALEVGPVSPPLAAARKALLVEIRKTEKSLVDSLDAVLEAPSLTTDPAIASLVRSHRLLVQDLRWLSTIPEQARSLAAFDPADSTALEQALIRRFNDLAADLTDHARRPDALQARAQLSRQIEAFSALSAEHAEREPLMTALLGAAQWAQIRQALTEARREWARGWATDERGSGGARRLLTLYRMLRCAEAAAVLGDDVHRAALAEALARWSGWAIPPDALREAVESSRDLPGGLSGEDSPEERRIRQMEQETALARLALWLAPLVTPALGTHPNPAVALLGPLAASAPPEAWAQEHLESLARLAVLARAWLDAGGNDAAADPLREALNLEANTLLHQLGEWRGPIPTLRRG